jgi:hypothetical protein
MAWLLLALDRLPGPLGGRRRLYSTAVRKLEILFICFTFIASVYRPAPPRLGARLRSFP